MRFYGKIYNLFARMAAILKNGGHFFKSKWPVEFFLKSCHQGVFVSNLVLVSPFERLLQLSAPLYRDPQLQVCGNYTLWIASAILDVTIPD